MQFNNTHSSSQRDNQGLSHFMKRPPAAWAAIYGSEKYPSVKGTVRFYQMKNGVLVVAEVDGLPKSSSPCQSPVFAFHIHDGVSCQKSIIEPRNGNNNSGSQNGNNNNSSQNGNLQPPDSPQPPDEDITTPENDPFPHSGTHYNPNGCPHPYHAGDMPPLFGADGYAFLTFVTSRFTVNEIVGKTVIIHSSPDDFTTQPSGNSGEKIACGLIVER